MKSLGDSSVLHCASLLRTIFASLAQANEFVQLHNERDFPQTKLDSEINIPFLLNEHADLFFLSHNNSVHIILFEKKIKKNYWTEKKIKLKACSPSYHFYCVFRSTAW